jgi:ABC-2 type transport system permease protein
MKSTPPPAVGRTLGSAWGAFRLGAVQTIAGWPVLVGRCLFYIVIMVVVTALWDKVAAERLAGTLSHTVSGDGFALYVGVTEWITLALPAVHLRLEDDIRSGALEPHLLRPKSYLLQRLAQSLGETLVRLAALGATALAMLAASGRPGLPTGAFAYLPLLGVLAVAVGMLLYALSGLMAFWARRTLPFQLVVQKAMFILGGLFAPITLYPPWLAQVGEVSPFAAHLYWAGGQALTPSRDLFVQALGWQMLWIVVLSGLCVLLWRAGLSKVIREGGV